MTYRIDISRLAFLDAENVYLWMKTNSEERANQWFKGLVEATNSLKEFPNRCPIVSEGRSFLIEIRQLIYGKGRQQYRIIFGVSVDEQTGEDVVLIYRIKNASQKYLSGLEILGESNDE